METRNRLGPHLCLAVEHGDGISDAEVTLKERAAQPHTRIPIPGFQTQEEGAPQNLTVKSCGDSERPVRHREPGNPDVPFRAGAGGGGGGDDGGGSGGGGGVGSKQHISAQTPQAKGEGRVHAARVPPPAAFVVTIILRLVQHGDLLWLLTPVSLSQHRLQ